MISSVRLRGCANNASIHDDIHCLHINLVGDRLTKPDTATSSSLSVFGDDHFRYADTKSEGRSFDRSHNDLEHCLLKEEPQEQVTEDGPNGAGNRVYETSKTVPLHCLANGDAAKDSANNRWDESSQCCSGHRDALKREGDG
jgi:hypothetical protein